MFEETVSVVPSIWASVNSWFTPAVFFVLLNLMIGTIFVTSCFAPHPKPKQSTVTGPDVSDDQHEKQQQSESQSKPKPDPSPSILERLKSINLYAYKSPEAPVEISLPIPAVKSSSPSAEDGHVKQQQSQSQSHSKPKPDPSPSILERLKSINFYAYESPEAPVQISLPIPAVKPSSPQHPPEAGYAPFQSPEDPEAEAGGRRGHGDQTLDAVYGAIEERRRVNRSQSDTRPAPGKVRKIKKSASAGSAFDHFEAEEAVQGNTASVEIRRPATVREGRVAAATVADDHEVDAKADDFINKFRQQLQLQRMESNIRYKEVIMRGSDM